MHWPIRHARPDELRRPTVAEVRTRAALDGDVPGHLAELKEALTTLTAVSQSLTKEVLARAAADPAHAQRYELLVRAISLQAGEIRKQTHRAPHAD
jgi:hypothetical protein